MKNNDDKNIEAIVESMMQSVKTESPSLDFTKNIMTAITAEKSKAFVYKPLIPVRVWLFIFTTILGIAAYLILNPAAEKTGFTFSADIAGKINRWIPSFHVADASGIVIILAAVMLCIQIFLLNNYFSKKIHS